MFTEEQVPHKYGAHKPKKQRLNRGMTQKAKSVTFRYIHFVMNKEILDYLVGAVILINAIFMALQTDWAARGKSEHEVFYTFEVTFTIFFAMELTFRICAERSQFITGRNRNWNFIDTFVVLSSVAELVLVNATVNLTVVRIVRILRLIRLMRFIRVLRFFSDLRVMIQGVLGTVSSLVWALILLIGIMFVFGICITQAVTYELTSRDEEIESILSREQYNSLSRNYGSLLGTMYSLFKAICGGMDWSELADPLITMSPLLGIGFCLYISFVCFAVLNVITGVFVENAIKTRDHDADMIMVEHAEDREQMTDIAREIFEMVDEEGRGFLTMEQFENMMNQDGIQAFLCHLGLDLEGTMSPHGLFTLLDFNHDGSVDIDEFIFGCGRLKGTAKSLDMARLIHIQRGQSEHLLLLSDYLEEVLELFEHLIARPPLGEPGKDVSQATSGPIVLAALGGENEMSEENESTGAKPTARSGSETRRESEDDEIAI